MPFRPEHSLLNLNFEKMHTIDTRSVENLFGLWTVFSKTSGALEDGKRLENLSWRLWNRETFCCRPDAQKNEPRVTAAATTQGHASPIQPRAKSSSIPRIPELATSVDTVSSDGSVDASEATLQFSNLAPPHMVRPELTKLDSCESRSRGSQKHITPVDLEKIVVSIRQKKPLEPLEPLQMPSSTNSSPAFEKVPEKQELSAPRSTTSSSKTKPTDNHMQALPTNQGITTVSAPKVSALSKKLMESSTSTVGASSSSDSGANDQGSESSSTAMSTHNVVRGFTSGAPSSYRSQTNLAAQPTPILKNSPRRPSTMRSHRNKGAMFTLGGSSGEEESSLDSNMHKGSMSSNIAAGLNKSEPSKKQASFRAENLVSQVQDSPVFESEDEDDDEEDVDESAIDDDEDSSDWEDDDLGDDDESDSEEPRLFQRVDSRPNLTSRRSMLTSMMHEGDRAKAIQNAASRSTPALRRSRTTSPNGPSRAASPGRPSHITTEAQEKSHARPIIMTTSNTHQLALSPRTTRRNMLSSELTESLRKNLLWERQHKSSQNIAALKRRHTSTDVKNLRQHPEPLNLSSNGSNAQTFTNDYFHAGLGEFHTKGW